MDVYLMAVSDVSPDFVAMACRRFVQGQVEGASVTFRPTPAELAVEARRLRDKASERARIMGSGDGHTMIPERQRRLPGPRPKFIPYPALWDALRNEPELLKALEAIDNFDGITAISRTMAVEGLDAAKDKLRRLANVPARQKASAA